MKIHKVISKNSNDTRMEAVLTDDTICITKHCHKRGSDWYYQDGISNFGQPIYKKVVI